MSLPPAERVATTLAKALGWIDRETDALGPAIRPATTFLRDPAALDRAGRTFTRDDNPTFLQPEALLATLEGGAGALLFSSGMAAATAVFHQLKPGDGVLIPAGVYAGLHNWLANHGTRWGLEVVTADYADLTGLEALIAARKPALVWMESPSNPLWNVTDLAAVASLAKRQGALVVADNTVATPMLTRPLALGADVVLHSGSKYLNGHADVVAGALVVGAGKEALLARLAQVRNDYGAVLGPFEAWLMLRGMRTLKLRMDAICRNAAAIAQFLAGHPAVVETIYPGLPTHAGHALAARQMTGGFGGMISFRPVGGAAAAHRIAGAVRSIRQAISFGGLETVIEIRRGMEGPASETPDDLLRLSVGIEDAQDLIDDLAEALGR
jgi:cystathionine gamma-synthase